MFLLVCFVMFHAPPASTEFASPAYPHIQKLQQLKVNVTYVHRILVFNVWRVIELCAMSVEKDIDWIMLHVLNVLETVCTVLLQLVFLVLLVIALATTHVFHVQINVYLVHQCKVL